MGYVYVDISLLSFIEFATVREADTAIQKFDQYEMGKGIKLRVRISESKEDREKRLSKKQEEDSFLSSLSSTKHTIGKRNSEVYEDIPTHNNITVVNNKPLGVEEADKEVKGIPASPKLQKHSSSTPTEKSKPKWNDIVKPHASGQREKAHNSLASIVPAPPQFFSKASELQPSEQLGNQHDHVAIGGSVQICANCKQPGKKRCAACKTYYCSKECQASDWPSHKLICRSGSGKDSQLMKNGITDDFQLSVPTDTDQINKLFGLKSPPVTPNAAESKNQFTELKDSTSFNDDNVSETPHGVTSTTPPKSHFTGEVDLPPLPPETPPYSPKTLPSIKLFNNLPSSFPVQVLRASSSNSLHVQVQCQEVQKANKEYKRMIESEDFQFEEENNFAKNKGCVIKDKNGQYHVAKIRSYKKDVVSAIKCDAEYVIATKGNIFVLPPPLQCLVDSLFKFTLYDVLPFEGTDRDGGKFHLESLTIGKMLTCSVVSQSELKYVWLTDPSDGKVINELMGESEYAVLVSSMVSYPSPSSFKITFSASDVPQHCPTIGKQTEILPLVVVNPNMIWAQENHSHVRNFIQLYADMNTFFSQRRNTNYRPTVGELCAAWSNKSWHRVEVLSCNTNGNFLVQLIDSGVKQTTSCANLRGLEEYKFLTLPRQAFLVSLSGVEPIDPSGIWEDKAIQFLNDRITQQNVQAEVVFVKGNKFSVKMIDPSSVDNLTVNQLLVSEGFAKAKLSEANVDHATQSVSMPTTPNTPNVIYYQSAEKSPTTLQPQENSLNHSDFALHTEKMPLAKKDSLKSNGSQSSLMQKVDPSEKMTSGSFAESKSEESLSHVSSQSSVTSEKHLQFSSPPIPSLETEWPAMVTHAIDPMNIWVLPQDKLEAFATVLTSTEKHCSLPTKQKCTPKIGAICLAPFDNHYYRGRIVSICQASVDVEFVDFGNIETVPSSKLITIVEKLCEIPALAVHCKLDRITYPNAEYVFSSECKQFFKANVSDKQVIVQIHRKVDGKVAVSIQIQMDGEDVDLSYELVKRGFAAFVSGVQNGIQTPSDIQTPADSPKPFIESDLPEYVLPNNCQVGITKVCSPSQFWVIEVEQVSKLSLLNKELNDFASSATAMPLSADYTNGCLCCALFNEDNTWYRAVILSCDGSNYTVRFLDYGNECTAAAKNVCMLPSSLATHPPCAVRCGLFGIEPFKTDWSPESTEFLMSNTQSIVLNAKSHGKNKDTVMLELFDSDGQSLSDQMVYAELAKFSSSLPVAEDSTYIAPNGVDLPLSGKFQVSITFVSSPLEFWVQTTDTEKQQQLNSLMEKLQAFYSNQSNHHHASPTVGVLYCSKFQDNFFYRCKVVEVYPKNGTVKILYIDFGNCAVIQASLLLKLHHQFTTANPFSVKCSLSEVSPSMVDSTITKQFSEMVLGQTLNCTCTNKNNDVMLVNLFTADDHSLFDVFFKDTSIKPSVMPTSEVHVSVSTVNSPSSIFVQIVTPENKKFFLKMTEQLQLFCSKASQIEPHVGAFCSALFKEDKRWYRAKILSFSDVSAFVSYVDFGNQAEVPFRCIKPLPSKLTGAPAFALEVSLAGVEPAAGSQWSVLCKKFLCSLMENKIFVMHPCSSQGDLNCADFIDASQECQKSVTVQLVSAGYAKHCVSQNLNEHLSNGHDNLYSSIDANNEMPQQCSDVSDMPAEVYMFEKMSDMSLAQGKDSCEVVVMHAASLKELYVMTTDHVEKLGEMINLVQAQAAIPVQFNRPLVIGELCLAKFTEDNSWYRAEVIKLLDRSGLVLVRFVDFGNSETVSFSSLLPINKDLFNLPLITFSCALYGALYTSINDPNLVKSLITMTQSKKLLCKIVNHVPLIVDILDPLDPSGLTVVEQLCYSESLHSIIASDNIRVPLTMIPTDDYVVGTVTDVTGPHKFHMQILGNKIIPAFQKMCEKLEEYKKLPPATNPIYVGQLVCAISTEDGTCYRARVIDLPSNQEAVVYYVDYGNQEIVPVIKIWPMKHELQLIPFIAVTCCLKEYEKAKSVPGPVVQQFSNLVVNRHLQVRKINAHPPYGSTVVELVDTNQATDVIIHKALS